LISDHADATQTTSGDLALAGFVDNGPSITQLAAGDARLPLRTASQQISGRRQSPPSPWIGRPGFLRSVFCWLSGGAAMRTMASR